MVGGFFGGAAVGFFTHTFPVRIAGGYRVFAGQLVWLLISDSLQRRA